MVAPFPGGVVDDQRGLAFTRLADGEIVAIELSTGLVKWRSPGAGRPIGATREGLVTIASGGDRIEIAILGAQDGAVRRAVSHVPIPAWVAQEIDRFDGFAATAVDRDGGIEVTWKARALYREGAPPSKTSGSKELTGRFVIPADSDEAIAREGIGSQPAAQDSDPSFETPMEVRHGDRSYRLESVTRSPAEIGVVLQSRDPKSGSVIWEREIKRLPNKKPPPLRM